MTARPRSRRVHLPPGVSRWVRPLLVAAVAVASIAALAAFVFPTRTWLDQRAALAETTAELEELEAERAELEGRLAALDDDATLEAIARADYGLVRPGEEAYAVLPAVVEPIVLPPLWPYGVVIDQREPASIDTDAVDR